MKLFKLMLILAAIGFAAAVNAATTELSCSDFRPTAEALAKYGNLRGACEGIVDRDGELFAKFSAVVRRVSGSNLTLYLPVTDHTFRVQADPSLRVLVDGRKTRVRALTRGQEIRIYLSVAELARPDIEEVAFLTETDAIVDLDINLIAALPATASLLPTVASAGSVLLSAGFLLRRRRLRRVLEH